MFSVHIGDKLCAVMRRISYIRPYEAIVTKVGTKWVYFTTSWNPGGVHSNHVDRFTKIDGLIEGSRGQIWLTRESYDQSQHQQTKWQLFRQRVDQKHEVPNEDWLEELAAQLVMMRAKCQGVTGVVQKGLDEARRGIFSDSPPDVEADLLDAVED